jgi:hypothetical protein
MQQTAFGARDRAFFDAVVCRAPRRRLMSIPLGGPLWQRNSAMAPSNAFLTLLRQIFRLPRMHLDATGHRPSVWIATLCGAGLGLIWGIAARIWMRLISTQPEFSVPGTVAILLIATLFGTFVGLAFAARQKGWRQWGHYVPRGLVVTFFLPFGIAGGMPLMLTVLLVTLAITHTAVVGLWVLALLAILLVIATDIGIPMIAAIITSAGAVALTIWKWLTPRWKGRLGLVRADIWLERLGRMLLLLFAASGFGIVAQGITHDKPGLLGAVYVLCYIALVYPLFLALRVGLEPLVLDD